MLKKGIRGGRCHAIHQYARANNKYLKHYDKNKEFSYLKYSDINNLYDWEMPPKLPVNGFKWVEDLSEFDEGLIKSYNEKSEKAYFLEVDIQYLENLHNIQNNLSILPDKMNIEKGEKTVANLHNKNEYFIHIRNLKQALNHGLVLKKVHRFIKFNQKTWPRSYIEMNTAKKKQKMIWKRLFTVDELSSFQKNDGNFKKKHTDIKLVTTEKRRTYLVSEPNYYNKNFFT